jgi:hypothetical protein
MNPCWGEIFWTHPHLSRGPHNQYWVFFQGGGGGEVKRPGRGVDHPSPSSAKVEWVWIELYFSLHCYRIAFTFTKLQIKCLFSLSLSAFVSPNAGDNTNKVLNENWKEFFEELRPILRDTFGAEFLQYTNHLFHKIPENELFLESWTTEIHLWNGKCLYRPDNLIKASC